jgi:hypothetical protein
MACVCGLRPSTFWTGHEVGASWHDSIFNKTIRQLLSVAGRCFGLVLFELQALDSGRLASNTRARVCQIFLLDGVYNAEFPSVAALGSALDMGTC